MNAVRASIRLSGGSVRVTSTASFSSSGFAGMLVAVFRSVDGPFGVVELAADSSFGLPAGGAFAVGLSDGVGVLSIAAAGLSVVCGEGVAAKEADGVGAAAVSVGWIGGVTEASGVADGCDDSAGGAIVAVASGFGVSVGDGAGVSVASGVGVLTVRGRCCSAIRVSAGCVSRSANVKLFRAPKPLAKVLTPVSTPSL